MLNPGPVFSRPRTPAARALHLVRLNSIVTRSELVEATGLSQPTITRTTAALLAAGLIHERTDLTQTRGRGRPTVPLEISQLDWLLAGIAVGTSSTYIALYDLHGRTILADDIPTPVKELDTDDFIEHIMAGLNRLRTGTGRKLISVGLTCSGHVDDNGLVYAENLGWNGVDIEARLGYQFSVPVVVAPAVPAILGSETQADPLAHTTRTMVLFADDSIGAALADSQGLSHIAPIAGAEELTTAALLDSLAAAGITATSLSDAAAQPSARDILNNRAQRLGELAATLVAQHQPDTLVVAGSAFIDDPEAPKIFAGAVKQQHPTVQLRLIPTHQEVVRSIARAVALDPLLRTPLSLVPAEPA